jgi:hypothetical protein
MQQCPVAHAAGQTWLTDGTIEEHARLLTRLDNFLRTSPAVMDALTSFMARDTGLPNPGYAASLLIAEVSFAALWHHQIAGQGHDGLTERIGITFP